MDMARTRFKSICEGDFCLRGEAREGRDRREGQGKGPFAWTTCGLGSKVCALGCVSEGGKHGLTGSMALLFQGVCGTREQKQAWRNRAQHHPPMPGHSTTPRKDVAMAREQ